MSDRDELRRLGIPDDLIVTVNGKPLGDMKPRKPKRQDRMTKPEGIYSFELEALQREGAIQRWAYESIKVRLAKRTWYTPDFAIWFPDGHLRIVEIKGGFVRDDAAAKFKIARETYPEWEWVCLQRVGQGWREILK